MCGKINPLLEILELQDAYNFRIHADAAYGGYFKLVSNLSEKNSFAFNDIYKADSIVVDLHKHGLQPYGYFTSDELHLGLEKSVLNVQEPGHLRWHYGQPSNTCRL